MKRGLTFLILLFALTSCNRATWSTADSSLINSAHYSRMRVTTIDNPIDSLLLRTPSAPLTHKDILAPEFGRLVASMIECVNDPQNAGVGIAAPQVGILRRVVVVQRLDKVGTPFEVYVNPRIIDYGEQWALGSEGCLSVPNLRGEVNRSQSISLTYNHAITFAPITEQISGFTAVIFQHELDHLDGIIYTDRAERVLPERE